MYASGRLRLAGQEQAGWPSDGAGAAEGLGLADAVGAADEGLLAPDDSESTTFVLTVGCGSPPHAILEPAHMRPATRARAMVTMANLPLSFAHASAGAEWPQAPVFSYNNTHFANLPSVSNFLTVLPIGQGFFKCKLKKLRRDVGLGRRTSDVGRGLGGRTRLGSLGRARTSDSGAKHCTKTTSG